MYIYQKMYLQFTFKIGILFLEDTYIILYGHIKKQSMLLILLTGSVEGIVLANPGTPLYKK